MSELKMHDYNQRKIKDAESKNNEESKFDKSTVEYLRAGIDTFEIFFDKTLFEAPKIVVELEKKIAAELLAKAKKAAAKR